MLHRDKDKDNCTDTDTGRNVRICVCTYTVVLVLFFFLLSVFLSVTVVGTGRCMYLGSLGTSGARCSVMRRFRTENGLLDWAVGEHPGKSFV